MAEADSETQPRRGSQTNHPSMIGGHAKYVAGAISSTLGYASGEDTKNRAVDEMRQANNQSRRASASENDPSQPPDQPDLMKSDILGTVEKKLGELSGCEGMVDEGKERMTGGGAGVEEQSGTG